MAKNDWGRQAPIYVTRETADGLVGEYHLSLWMTLLILIILCINALLWGGIAIYEAITRIF